MARRGSERLALPTGLSPLHAARGRPRHAGHGRQADVHAHEERRARAPAARLPDRVDADVLTDRLHTDAVTIVTRNRPILERLRRRYRLGIVSNFTGNLQPCLEELDLARLFVVVSDSTVVGWSKPDARIF